MKTRYSKHIGTVSHGTMRPEDLIPEFIYTAKSFRLTREEWKTVSRIAQESEQDGYYDGEFANDDLDSLFNILDSHALPYFYFGSHPGDGSDYGYWLSESLQEDFDGPQVSDMSELPAGYVGEFLVINDHGNTSLMSRGKNGHIREIWAVV